MPPTDPAKHHAARLAADLVQPGMIVGLGSGSTAALLIERLGERVSQEGIEFLGVPTSQATADLARSVGLSLVDLDEVESLDLDLDGADEVDPQFRMVKGRGGALLREKIVATASTRRVFIVGEEKRVDRLGTRFPVPVEVSPFGLSHTDRAIQTLGATTRIRLGADAKPYSTDGQNRILDCSFLAPIDDPEGLDIQLRRIAGVFETGFFLGLCNALIVGGPDRAILIEAPR